MDAIVDALHPGQWNLVVLACRSGVALRQLDNVGAFAVIDGADVLAIGSDNFHVLSDVGGINHLTLSFARFGEDGPRRPLVVVFPVCCSFLSRF